MFHKIQCVILTHGDKGTPHKQRLVETNPWLDVSVWTSSGDRGAFPNCDRNVRDWARVHEVSADFVLFLEYDVCVTGDISPLFNFEADLEGSWFLPDLISGRHFSFLHTIKQLPEEMQKSACVLAPLAVLLVSKKALLAVTNPTFDALFDLSMDSEVRFPSVITGCGFRVSGNANLPHVCCQLRQLPKTCTSIIRHPAKV